jgi:hypothetical protein
MTMTKSDVFKPSNGLVISYNYLWAREHDNRQESDPKARPACVRIIVQSDKHGRVVAHFPITSQSAHATRTALEIPEIEARRIGLKPPSWIMVDEWNLDDLAASPYVADSRPFGPLQRTAFAHVAIVQSLAANCSNAAPSTAIESRWGTST